MHFLLGLLLLIGPGQLPGGAGSDTVTVRVKYGISIKETPIIPNFLGIPAFLAQVTGLAPSTIDYLETDVIDPSSGDAFSMALRGRNGRTWIVANSDTSRLSLIDPPDIPGVVIRRDSLRPGAIRFISGIREFFRIDTASWFSGTFDVWKDTLTFYAWPDDSLKAAPGFRAYRVESFNQLGLQYMDIRLQVGLENGVLVYPKVDLYLCRAKSRIVLELKSIQFTKK